MNLKRISLIACSVLIPFAHGMEKKYEEFKKRLEGPSIDHYLIKGRDLKSIGKDFRALTCVSKDINALYNDSESTQALINYLYKYCPADCIEEIAYQISTQGAKEWFKNFLANPSNRNSSISWLIKKIGKGNKKEVLDFLKKVPQISGIQDELGDTLLMHMVSNKEYALVEEMLKCSNVNIDAVNIANLNALFIAIDNYDDKMLSLLLDYNASQEGIGESKTTPLMRACAMDNVQAVETLLWYGANLDYTGAPIRYLPGMALVRRTAFSHALFNNATKCIKFIETYKETFKKEKLV